MVSQAHPRVNGFDKMLEATLRSTRNGSIQSEFDGFVSRNDDELEKRDSDLRIAWDGIMGEGNYAGSPRHDNVHVLMLSWDSTGDDLDVKREVTALKKVFEDFYHYDVTYQCLQTRPNKKTQQVLNAIVAQWVLDHDGHNTLLMVYFAGHGSEVNGSLQIAGRLNQSSLERVTWDQTESNLAGTDADILIIFDCCSAGSLGDAGRSWPADDRAYEYLGATSSGRKTPKPGPDSFTSALIYALEHFAKEARPFTTTALHRKIWKDAPNFPRSQRPTLNKNSKHGHAECIILRPLESKENRLEPSAKSIEFQPPLAHDQETLTLKLIFNKQISTNDLRVIGKSLNNTVTEHHLQVNHIQYGGVSVSSVMKAMNAFKSIKLRKGSTAQVAQITPAQAEALLQPAQHQPTVADESEEDENGFTERVQANLKEGIHEEIERQCEFIAQTASQRQQAREQL